MLPQTISETLKDLFFPKLCLGCRKQGTLLCDKCWPQIQFIYDPICPVCQHPSVAGRTHAGCQTPWSIDGAISLTFYRGPIRSLVRQLKYHGVTVTQQLVGQILQNYLQHESLYLPPAIIVPIPLHQNSQNQRGFNQATVIAQVLASQTGYPMLQNVLQRHKNTPSQTKLSKSQRQSNMLGAFSLSTTENIKGASFILVDDVFTTGATLKEAAKVLKRARAKQVFGFTLARD
jgi:ComF family protein